MKTISDKQMGLLRVLSRFWWAQPGDCRCSGYSHAIGANNGLKGLVRSGYATHRWRFRKGRAIGSEYQITDAGRKQLEVPAQP